MTNEKDTNKEVGKEIMGSKSIYKLEGLANRGKTSTLNYVIDILIEKYSEAIIGEKDLIKHKNGDRRLVMTVKTESGKVIKIGVETLSDVKNVVKESLEYFEKLGCNIIFCAARTYKSRFTTEIDSYKAKGYTIYPSDETNSDIYKAKQDAQNKERAKKMIENASL